MSTDGTDWLLVFWQQLGGCDDKDDDELTDAEDDYALDAANDLIYDCDVEDDYYEAAEAPEEVVEEGSAAAEDEGGREPVALERDGGEERVPEAGAEEEDDEETESEYGDPIENEREPLADEGDGEEDETEYLDAVEGDDDDDSSDDEDDEETDTDFSDASDEDMEEGESDEEGQGGESSSHHRAAEGVGVGQSNTTRPSQGQRSSAGDQQPSQGQRSARRRRRRRGRRSAQRQPPWHGQDDENSSHTRRPLFSEDTGILGSDPPQSDAEKTHRKMLAAVHVDGKAAHTRAQYACNWRHYKRWVTIMMMTLLTDVIPESEKIDLANPDEVGRYMGDDAKLSWDSVDDSEQHLHGPRVTGWRIIRYLEYLFNETPAQAITLKGDAPVVAGREPKPSTPKMIKARMNAIGCLGRCESALYDYPLTQMQDKVAQGRAFMRVKLVNLNEEQIRTGADQHRGSLDDCYNVDQYKELHHNILPEETFKIYARSKDFPSQAPWRVLAVKVMIQLAHQVLGRGVSIRKIRFANMFIRMCRSSTRVKGKMDLPVLVVASRKTKTNLSNNLTHQYLARHIDWQLYGVGGVFLWIHWLYDLVPIRYGKGVVPRLDFWKPRKWTRKHLFFGISKPKFPGPQPQDEMKYETHNNWIRWVMKQAKWMFSKVTHIFRRSGAQGLSDDRCPDTDIGALGGWEQGEMRKAYIIGIPFHPMLMMAGFTGTPRDYYIGRAHAVLPVKKEWKKLKKLFRKHIFPWAEKQLKKGEHEKAKLLGENHCLRKENGLKDVRNDELQAQMRDLQSDNKSLMHQLAQLKAELAALTVSSTGNVGADNSAARGAASSKMEKGGAGPSAPEPSTPTPEIVYFDSVVRPWRDSTTVAEAWVLWNKSSFLVEGRTLRAVADAAGFIVKWAHFKRGEEIEEEKGKFKPTVRLDAKDGTCERQLRRINRAMTAVEKFRVDDSVEATTEAVNVLDEVLFQTCPTQFADGLIVKGQRGTKRQRTSTAGGESLTDDAQERVSYLLVFYGLRDDTWGEELFSEDQWLSIKTEDSQKPLKRRPGAGLG
ncbi:unnamed protein product [Closterium sp. Naga37s-1]|nr:unnamed protein product [Closterium sp. Naga37s-1]